MSEEHPQSAGALENNDKLGRDDPVWPLYVEEATSWDAALVREWNQYAALFSAIVTAFVIESSKSLQEDNAAATVLKLVEISETLQLIALGARPNVTSPSAAEPFQPTKNAVLVNKLWFISLSLSITVSLVAILVKQWCNGLTSESFTSPCQQARTRQARYQALIDWHTRDIVEFLPIIMHSALGPSIVWHVVYRN
ncbi:hypothetical protein BDV93DRAFT_459730 [Ceratobasidium sp. AG-I]|nr:hypothetical protein BDV93DRAFT_459730 [Ceratobasidium sp. AG-I]